MCAHSVEDTSVIIIFFFNDTATTEIYTLSLHDALPISGEGRGEAGRQGGEGRGGARGNRPSGPCIQGRGGRGGGGGGAGGEAGAGGGAGGAGGRASGRRLGRGGAYVTGSQGGACG